MIYFIGEKRLIDSTLFQYSTVEECLEYFKAHKSIAVDTETKGRDPHDKPIICIQIGDKDRQYVIDVRCINIKLFKNLLESKVCLFQNFKFDYKFFKHAGINIEKVWDTMIAECCLYRGYEHHGYGLLDIAKRYLNVDLNKTTRGEFFKLDSQPFTDDQIEYAALDVAYLHQIAELQYKDAIAKGLVEYIVFEFEAIKPLADIEYNGMLVDAKGWVKNTFENEDKLNELEKSLDNELLNLDKSYKYNCSTIQSKGKTKLVSFNYDLFEPDKEPERLTNVLWTSDTQVKKIFKEVLNLVVVDKEGKETTNSNYLLKVKNKPKLVTLLIEHRELAKAISTYGKGFIDQYQQADGKVRTSFWQIRDTGRVSSGDTKQGYPNTQNIPQDLRKYFVAPKGYKYITLDYSQQEPRLTAHYCQDPKLMDFVLNGDGDSHSLIASAIFSKIEGKEIVVTKKNNPYSDRFKMTYRDVGKMINLGLDYGKTAFTVKDDLGVSQEEAQAFIDAIKERFPKKEQYFQQKIKESLNTGYILIDPVLRSKTFINDYDIMKDFDYESASAEERRVYYKAKGSISRNAQNYPIQGTAALMTKKALCLIRQYFIDSKVDAQLVNCVHDEVNIVAEESVAEEVAKKCSELMVEAGKLFCSTVPMIAEPVIANNWSK